MARLKTEDRLPKWGQAIIAAERKRADDLEAELKRTREASAITLGRRGWTTIQGPPKNAIEEDTYCLFYLSPTGAHVACSLGRGDVLLIGRADKG